MRTAAALSAELVRLADGQRMDFPPSWLARQLGISRDEAARWLGEQLPFVPGLSIRLVWACDPSVGGDCGGVYEVDALLKAHPEREVFRGWRCPGCGTEQVVVRKDLQVEFTFIPPPGEDETTKSAQGEQRGASAPRRNPGSIGLSGGESLTVGHAASIGIYMQVAADEIRLTVPVGAPQASHPVAPPQPTVRRWGPAVEWIMKQWWGAAVALVGLVVSGLVAAFYAADPVKAVVNECASRPAECAAVVKSWWTEGASPPRDGDLGGD